VSLLLLFNQPSVGGGVTGTLSQALADARIDGIGSVYTNGTLSQVLSDAVLNGIGTVAISGSFIQTLGEATLSATGVITSGPISGALAVVLDDAILAAIGTSGSPQLPSTRVVDFGAWRNYKRIYHG
jgi:hypothetical protein